MIAAPCDRAALVALGLRAAFAMRTVRVLAQAAVVLARPSAADRLLPAQWGRAVALHRAASLLPDLAGDAALAWLGAQLGVDFATHPARALGVTVGRVFPAGAADGRRRFDWAPNDRSARTGTRAILIPTIGDVVAVDAADPRAAWSLSGDLDPLGGDEPALDDALAREAPAIGLCEDALSWLAHLTCDAAGGLRAVLRHGPGDGDVAPAVAVLDWRAPWIDRLLRRDGVTLIAESEGHAEQVERAIDAWRKRQVPRHRPEILVAETPAREGAAA